MKKHVAKRQGRGLGLKTFTSPKSGKTYLAFLTPKGSYHIFVETEAKAAGRDCGGKGANTRVIWKGLWDAE